MSYAAEQHLLRLLLPDPEEPGRVLVVASSGLQAQHLRRALRSLQHVTVAPYYCLYGLRADVILAMPLHRDASQSERAAYALAYDESVLTRLQPGGRLLRL